MNKVLVTVVVPILNEEENLPLLNERLTKVLEIYNKYEVIYVNDGSTDNSKNLIEELCKESRSIKSINFSRNFGHQLAITAGLERSKGDVVLIIDGDLQDPPEVIPKFIDKWKEGYDVVYAVRTNRKENIIKRTAYFCFYRILNHISDINIPLDSGDFSAIDRKIVDHINSFPERNRFVRGIRSWVGFNQIGLAYDRSSRYSGKPKFTFTRLIKLAYDGLISFSHKPLKIAKDVGILVTFFSFLLISYVMYLNYAKDIEVQGWSSTIIVILFLGGIQLLMIGALGEYIARIFDEVKSRPNYIIESTNNFDEYVDGYNNELDES